MQTPQPSLVTRTLIILISIYRNSLRALMLPSCRFSPTCSDYATQALRRYGMLRGGFRAAWRLLRCHPVTKGGWDPVS